MSTVSRAEFARLQGVNKSTVTRWIQSGRIALTDDGRVDVAAAREQLKATGSPLPHHEARREQAAEARLGGAEDSVAGAATPRNASDPAPGTDVSLRLKEARARYEENRADMAALDRDQKAGLLVLRADAEYAMADIGRRLASLVERLADQTTPTLVGHKGDAAAIHATLIEAGRDLRVELAHYLEQRAAALSES